MPRQVRSESEYRQLIAQPGLVLSMFTTTDCDPFKRIQPQLQQLEQAHRAAHFLLVDVEQQEELAVQEGVRAMPTFAFYMDGDRLGPSTVTGADAKRVITTVENLSRSLPAHALQPLPVKSVPAPSTLFQNPPQTPQMPAPQMPAPAPLPAPIPSTKGKKRVILDPKNSLKQPRPPSAADASLDASKRSSITPVYDVNHYTQEVSNFAGMVVIEFASDNFLHCRTIAPVVEEMATRLLPRNIKFLKIDVDKNTELAMALEVQSVPTFMLGFQGGQLETFAGADTAYLEQRIDYWIGQLKSAGQWLQQ
jgi:thioredoxin 1